MKLFAAILALIVVGAVQAQVPAATASLGTPCPYYWTVLDWNAGTLGVQPTITTVQNSIYPLASNTATVTDTNTVLSYQPLPATVPADTQPCLVGASWNNSSNLVLYQPGGLSARAFVEMFTNTSASSQYSTTSFCTIYYSTEPATGSLYASGDTLGGGTTGSHEFTNRYWRLPTSITLNGTETGLGTDPIAIAQVAGSPAYSEGTGDSSWIFPYTANAWQWVCSSLTPQLTGQVNTEQGNWDQTTGDFLFSYITQSPSATSGDSLIDMSWGSTNNTTPDTAPSGGKYFWKTYICGLNSSAPNCPFPFVPGLAAIPPTPSQGAGSVPIDSTVSLTSPSINSATGSPGNIYYTFSGTATCSSTLYSGPITLSTPGAVTLSSVACPTGSNPTPSVAMNTAYTVTGNPTVSSSYYYAKASTSVASLTSNSVSSPAGTLVFANCEGSSSPTSFPISDNASGGTNTWHLMSLISGTGVGNMQVSWSLLSYPITTVTCTPSTSTTLNFTAIAVTCSTCSGSSTPVEKSNAAVFGTTWTSSSFTATGATNGWIAVVAAQNSNPYAFNSTDTIAGHTGALYATSVTPITSAAGTGLYAYVSSSTSLTSQTANFGVPTSTHLIGDVILFPW